MPFPKLRLKKKQQYNVASKAMYVITVELLDNNQLECSLTAESTGKLKKLLKQTREMESWLEVNFFLWFYSTEKSVFGVKFTEGPKISKNTNSSELFRMTF